MIFKTSRAATRVTSRVAHFTCGISASRLWQSLWRLLISHAACTSDSTTLGGRCVLCQTFSLFVTGTWEFAPEAKCTCVWDAHACVCMYVCIHAYLKCHTSGAVLHISASSVLGLQTWDLLSSIHLSVCLFIYDGFQGLNLGPHSWEASTLTTELSPQLPFWSINSCGLLVLKLLASEYMLYISDGMT